MDGEQLDRICETNNLKILNNVDDHSWRGMKLSVQLQAEQSDWLADTDEKIDEQELEAHYSYMAKIQEVPNADSGTDAEPLEQIVQLILFIVDSGCIKHMTGNLSLLCNFVEKYLGT
ncbi:hypothetical protein Tco_0914836 [Tanacetum coccineum]